MKLLFENENQQIYLHEDLSCIEQRFKPKSKEIFGKEYIKEIRVLGLYVNMHQSPDKHISKLIINAIDGEPSMEPFVQTWKNNHFYPQIFKAGIKCKAYCNKEMNNRYSTDDSNKIFQFELFDSFEESVNWVQSVC